MTRLSHLVLAAVLLFTFAAAAQQQDSSPTASNPLVRLLQSKGILSEQEAASINQAGTAADQQQRLSQLLLSKGIISQAEYNQTVVSASVPSPGSASLVPAVAHLAADSAASPPSPLPQEKKGPAVIPAVAPIRVLQFEPSKPGGLIPDIKLGSGAKLKFYGFLKATAQYDTSDPQNLDFVLPWQGSNGSVPQAVPTGLNSGIATIPGVGNTDSGPEGAPQFRVQARQARAGVNFEWPDLAGSSNTITGRLEFDFEGNYSRAQNRNVSSIRTSMLSLRLAWMRIDHKFSDNTSIYGLFGMDWTPFASSTLPNLLESTGLGVWFGNPYERAAQFRAGIFHNFGGDRKFTIGIEPAVVMPAFGNLPADVAEQLGVSERQGADSARPDIQGRIVFQFQADKAKGVAPAQIIFSGVHADRTAIVTRAAINAITCGGTPLAGTIVPPPCAPLVGGVPTRVSPLLLAAFPHGATVNSSRYGVTAELQLPTRFFTVVGKVYNGADLRFYFANQIFSTFNNNVAAGTLHAAPGGAACGPTGAGCPTAFNIDASSQVVFGFDPVTGAPSIVPQTPIRTSGGVGQISFPLSRILHANPEGRNAGWTLGFTYGIDQAKARDVKRASPTGTRGKSDMMVGTLLWKLNPFVTFAWETSLYRTRAYCSASEQAAAQAGGSATGACPAFLYRGVAAREWHDFRNQFGPTFTF